MKSLFLSITLLVTTCLAFGQNIDDLDARNGFSDISFTLELGQLKKVLSLKEVASSKKTGESTYMVKNFSDYNIYGYPLQAIYLSFYKQYLFQIQLKVKDITDLSMSSAIRWDIFKKVQAAYGRPSKIDSSATTRAISKCNYNYWLGKGITLIQSIPYGEASLYSTNDGTGRTMLTGDSWYFINNGHSSLRPNTQQGL